jgi:hypothetical protein
LFNNGSSYIGIINIPDSFDFIDSVSAIGAWFGNGDITGRTEADDHQIKRVGPRLFYAVYDYFFSGSTFPRDESGDNSETCRQLFHFSLRLRRY